MKNIKNTKGKPLADRMKDYEACYNFKIPNRSFMVVRLDGVGFSKFTKQFEKPFDDMLSNAMDYATIKLCERFNPLFAYTQSDEISLLFNNKGNVNSELIYDGKVQKIDSIFASQATAGFNYFMLKYLFSIKYSTEEFTNKIMNDKLSELNAIFDARVFVIPDITDVYNYFLFRQQDCTKNSISMAASANFSHKVLEGVNGSDKQEMLFSEKGINWNDYKVKFKRGVVVSKKKITYQNEKGEDYVRTKWLPDYNIPIFTQDKEYLENLVRIE